MRRNSVRVWLAASTSALLWIAILPGFILYIPFHFSIAASSNQFFNFSLSNSLGWIVFSISLIVGSRLLFLKSVNSRMRQSFPSIFGVVGFLAAIFGDVGLESNIVGLFDISWILVAAVFGCLVSMAFGLSWNKFDTDRAMRLSAIFALGPMLSLVIGGLFLSIPGGIDNFKYVAGLISLLSGILLTLVYETDSSTSSRVSDKSAKGAAAWRAYLLFSLIASFGVSLMNTFLSSRVAAMDLNGSEISNFTASLIALGALVSTLTILVTGLIHISSSLKRRFNQIGAIVLLASAATSVYGSSMFIFILASVLCGVGFGLTNAVEVYIVEDFTVNAAQRAITLGVFTAITCLPYVFTAPVGSILLSLGAGATSIYWLAFVAFLLATALATFSMNLVRK